MSARRRPIPMLPECKAQAVCTNGRNCLNAGRCLRVDVLAHWLAYSDREHPPMAVSPVWIGTAKLAEDYRRGGYRVEGPFVPVDQLRAVEALREIATRPTVERNPDGDDQAAHTMQLIAREALDRLGGGQ
jgi:hypothetical protein